MNNASHSLTARIPAGIGILIVTLVVIGAIVLSNQKAQIATTTKSSSNTSATSSNPATTSQAYKDGTYTETGTYNSPAGKENVGVSLTLANGVVTDSTVTREANDPTASSYQGLFISGYKDKVTGKKIADIKLTNVAGSSLTPIGFMNALKKIEADAAA